MPAAVRIRFEKAEMKGGGSVNIKIFRFRASVPDVTWSPRQLAWGGR